MMIVFLGIAGSFCLGQSPSGPAFASRAPAGTLVIVGGGAIPPSAEKAFLDAARSGHNHLVVIPSASASANEKPLDSWKKPFDGKVGSVSVLHAANRAQAMNNDFSAILGKASAVWISGGDQKRLETLYAGTPVESAMASLLDRGGTVGGTSAGAAILSGTMITGGTEEPEFGNGFNLLNRVIIDQHFSQRKREKRLAKAVLVHPDHAGLGIDESTAVVIRGRQFEVIGAGRTWWYTVSEGKIATASWGPGERDDLVRLHRAAFATKPVPSGRPVIGKGAVVAVGGGGMGPEIAKKFIQLAGGDGANIVILPTAAPETSPTAQGEQAKRLLSKGGDAKFQVLASARRQEVESPEYLTALEKANGVWFGGGRQWRFVDAYEGTRFQTALEGVLKRGGVIGGSSAGATILGDYLCRGGPLGNTEIMVPGYDRGFAYLKGVGIDQHFSQRKRFADMERFSKFHPEFIGVGIDEGTALIVTPKGAEALGPGKVHVYKAGKQVSSHATGEMVGLSP
jgi:cyanophycinase